MDENFRFRASLRTNEELLNCIDKREKYLPETVEAAVSELQSRNVQFSDEELNVVSQDMQARRELVIDDQNNASFFKFNDKNKIVEDPDAPLYYSRRAIYVFSILFSVLFGSVMLAMNIAKTKHAERSIWVVLYGLGFTAVTIFIAATYNLPSSAGIFFGMIGGIVMNALFWDRFIGNDSLFRLRPIWIPLAIAVVIFSAIIFVIISFGQV